MSPSRHRVLIIGAGFGGLAVARELASDPDASGAATRPGTDITIVDANNFHTFQPLLYQVATAGLSDDDVAHPIRKIFRRNANRWWPGRRSARSVQIVMGRVTAIDTTTHDVGLADGRRLGYDTLVVAAGAVSTDFGIDGVAEHAFALKSIDDANALRTHVLSRFEHAAADPTALGDGAIDVVVCGGGPTGVEMAGGLAELYHRVLRDEYPELPVEDAQITLVEMADRVLTPFTESSSAHAQSTLGDLGVDLRLGVGIDHVDDRGVALADGSRIDASTVVWAAGVTAHPIAAALGVELARGGRIPVDPDLGVTGCADVFAIGDIAAATDTDGRPLPQVAQPAIQGGRHVARQIRRQLSGDQTERFEYVDKGSMATIGRNHAVTELPNGWRLSGFIGWASWLALHLVYLMGFRNRLSVFVNWCWNYLTYDRSSRLLTETDVELRPRAEQP